MSHEQAYVNDIISAAAAHGRVESITVEVGELAPIPARELEAALSFTGWRLNVVVRPGTVSCACGFLGRPVVTDKGHDYTIYHCSRCKSPLPPIIDGKDVVLTEVTVKDPEEHL